MASFMYCSLSKAIAFPTIAAAIVNVFFSLLKTEEKKYLDSWKSNRYRYSNQGKKQRTNTINEAKKMKSSNFTRSKGEKLNVAVAIFGGSNLPDRTCGFTLFSLLSKPSDIRSRGFSAVRLLTETKQ